MQISPLAAVSQSIDGYLAGKVLSRERSDALVRQLGLLFSIRAEECDGEEIAVFDRALGRLLPDAETDTRGFLAIQISVTINAPPVTLRRLARDTISVARPILMHSPALGQEDLISIAVEAGLSHMAAIAEREELPVTVTDVLVQKGDDDVRRIVAGNHGARFSREGFRRLSAQAKDDEGLEDLLIGRDDVPEIVIRFLVRNGTGRARDRFAVAPNGMDLIRVDRDAGRPVPARTPGAWYAIYDFAAAEARLAVLGEHGLRGEPLLKRLIAEERFPEAAVLLSRLARVRLDDMVGWLTAEDPGAFLLVARTAGLDPRSVFGMLSIGPWHRMLSGRARQQAVTAYHAVEADEAQAWLRQWRRNACGRATPLASLSGSDIPSPA